MTDATEQLETDLHYWSVERFHELGYPWHQCEVLKLAHVDWHELERLLSNGCPREVALEILT